MVEKILKEMDNYLIGIKKKYKTSNYISTHLYAWT